MKHNLFFFSLMDQNEDVSCSNGKHDFVLDEEIGLKCRYCSYVSVEMKDVSPAMVTFIVLVNHTNCSFSFYVLSS